MAEALKTLMPSSEAVSRAILPAVAANHRSIAERRKCETILKQIHPERDKALATLLMRHVDAPDKLRRIASLASGFHCFPLDLLNIAPVVAHLQSIQAISNDTPHYSLANEMNILEKMKQESVQWLLDDTEIHEKEAHEQITEAKFYEVLELYVSDDIQDKMKNDPERRKRIEKWKTGMDNTAILIAESASVQGLSLSAIQEKLAELKNMCASALADGALRSRVESY